MPSEGPFDTTRAETEPGRSSTRSDGARHTESDERAPGLLEALERRP